MRILITSVAPLFPRQVVGGSQWVLQQVIAAIAATEHTARVLCTAHPENRHGFYIGNCPVEPQLLLRSFPYPWSTTPKNIELTINALGSAAQWADIAYLHSDTIYPRRALSALPIVRSLHDFYYPEAIMSAFTLPADLTIVPSNYLKREITATAHPPESIVVIPNGVAVDAYLPRPRLPSKLYGQTSGLDSANAADECILLFPHRPIPEKGLLDAMQIAQAMALTGPRKWIRLLCAQFPDELNSDSKNVTSRNLLDLGRTHCPDVVLQAYQWEPPQNMAGIYAAADVTLCPGYFPESFGLVPLESVAAGTPAVCANIGALGEFHDVPGVHLFHHGDINAAARLAMRALTEHRAITETAREFVSKKYPIANMRRDYVRAITGIKG